MIIDEELENYIQDVHKRVGNLINKVRTEKKISMRKVYRDTGICIACLSQLENASNPPRFAILIKLAKYLEIPLEQLLGTEII